MKQKKIVALLISLFVYPGSGHIYLGDKKRGYGISLLFTLILFVTAVVFQHDLLKAFEAVDHPEMIFTHAFNLAGQALNSNRFFYMASLLSHAFLWLYSAWDVFRIGGRMGE